MKSHIPIILKRPRHTGSREGSALITVLGVALILMLAGAAMVVLSRQSIFRIQRTSNNVQAQAVAESGIVDMIAKLGTNYTYWQSNSYTATFFSNGAYHVWSTPTNGHVLITSDGIYKGESNRTIIEVIPQNIYDINNVILANGTITLDTGAFRLHGDVHANQNITVGGNGTIDNGTYSASGNVIPSSAGLSHTPIIPIPTFDFDSYRQMATNGGAYYASGQTLSGKPIASAANGILYVNGDLTISQNSEFTGTIVANGNITINNNFNQLPFPSGAGMPSLLSTGTITINNNSTYYGTIYAAVSVDISQNPTINGGIISGGNVHLTNSTENPSTNTPSWDPLSGTTRFTVGAWLH